MLHFPSLSAWTHKTHGPEQDPYNLIHFVLREQHNISRTYDDHSYTMPDAMHERCILTPGTPSKWAEEHGFNVPFTKTGTLTARRDDNKPVKGDAAHTEVEEYTIQFHVTNHKPPKTGCSRSWPPGRAVVQVRGRPQGRSPASPRWPGPP